MQVQPSGPAPARIMIVGECPGDEELRQGVPFVGMSGQELGRILHDAGIMRSTCFLTNVIRVKAPGNDAQAFIATKKKDITPAHRMVRDKFVLAPIVDGMAMLQREIELVRPHVIVALGNVALWALTGQWGIVSWRGSVMQTDLPVALDYKPKVIPTYHPATILRQWSWRPMAVHDFKRVARQAQSKEFFTPHYRFVIRPQYHEVLSVLSQLATNLEAGPVKLACDIETRAGHIACVGLAWSEWDAICIPFMCLERPAGFWSEQEELTIVHALWQLLTHPNCHIVGQNFLYDAQYFWRWFHFIPRLVRDTMLTQHSLFGNLSKGLDVLSSLYLEYHSYWKDDGKEWSKDLDEDRLWRYNCEDACKTFAIDTAQQPVIDAMGMRDVVDFQQSLFWPVLDSMNRGIRYDQTQAMTLALQLTTEMEIRNQWLTEVLGYPLNIRSAPQMQDLFYAQLRQRPVFNRKTGNLSCDDEALRKLADREPLLRPLVKRIAELRSLGVFNSTFLLAPTDTDGRMRCSFNVGGTETYRFSSSTNAFGSGLNLQNIPKGGDDPDGLDLPNVRSLFIPDPGYCFFDIDLSSADLRIVVWEADETEMKAMLRAGLDPYTEIAKEFYHDPSITKKDPRRQTFKSFAHGTNYLGTAKGLAERLGLGVHEAEQTQKWYFSRFPRIKKWQDDLKDQVLKRRMVQNVFGYRCYFFDRIEGTIFNQAAAWIPQSTVACLINRAYVRIHREFPEVHVLLQVHDSLAGQYPARLGEWAEKRIVELASIELPYEDDPLVIPVGIKTSPVSWGGCA